MDIKQGITKTWDKVTDLLKTKEAILRHLQAVSFYPIPRIEEESIKCRHSFSPISLSKMAVSMFPFECHKQKEDWAILNKAIQNLGGNIPADNETLFPLTKLNGMNASKSFAQSKTWRTIKDFGESHNCADIPSRTLKDFEKNILHSFPQDKAPFCILHKLWQNKYYWQNSDGSHHAAAAYAHALKESTEFFIPARITAEYLAPYAVQTLLNNFIMIVVHQKTVDSLYEVCDKMNIPFQMCQVSINGDYGTLLFFPKSCTRTDFTTKTISSVAGSGRYRDFNAFLAEALYEQQKHAPFVGKGTQIAA